ncbi:hypothetical protein NH8B_0996 [Pseudogulbenkiania sp. NH8B]|uniref:hypothetical protein n=1 Tax=Pseudogulbenkiania sp. (strain NH8B) TaxID=748280 RepID=UPI0002279AFF|nr:hypothetical protein [Pseudogulbenkiania sp. NH8B]BAK75828.1 hypothetical protein NH8B_0996 [Pseudogulbenkiania sp. NH8B]
MTKTIRRRVALFFVALLTGVVALFAFRSLATATVAALLSGLSAQAIAGTAGAGAGKAGAAASGVHGQAIIGAGIGAALKLLQLRGRPWPERLVVTGASFAAAYYAGTFAAQRWALEPGGVALVGTAAAYVVVPVLDAARTVLEDIPWLKRLLFRRVTGVADEQASS